MRLLEAGGEIEEEGFGVDGGEELEARGKAGGRQAAGNGDGGEAAEVGRAIEAEEQGAGGVIFSGDGDIFFADERSGDWRGGCDEGIHFVFQKGEMEAGDEFFAQIEGTEIFEGGYFFAHFEA